MERDFRKGDPQELNPGAGIAGLLEGGKSGGCREREKQAALIMHLWNCFSFHVPEKP